MVQRFMQSSYESLCVVVIRVPPERLVLAGGRNDIADAHGGIASYWGLRLRIQSFDLLQSTCSDSSSLFRTGPQTGPYTNPETTVRLQSDCSRTSLQQIFDKRMSDNRLDIRLSYWRTEDNRSK